MRRLDERFQVDRFRYHLFCHEDGEVVLSLENAPLKPRDKYDLWREVDHTGDVGIVGVKAVKVMAKTRTLVKNWVFNTKPYRFSFEPSTTGKAKTYHMFAVSLQKVLADRYNFYREGSSYVFYRSK